MAVTYKEYNAKSMLRMHKYVDNWFWSNASLSPYKACEHACNYCDGRSVKYHASEDFDEVVHVKINGPEVLKKELNKMFPKQKTLSDFTGEGKPRRPKPVIIVSSGISDAYQPAERKYGLTRQLLEILRDFEMPTYVMTKSDLVLRDLDPLKEINRRSWCNVSFSLSTVDKESAGILEPKASTPVKRLKAMRKISEAGILTGVTYIPIIPYITDSDFQIEDTIRASKEHGAQYILAGTMTMRDQQAQRFYEILNEHYPELVEKYNKLYRRGYEPDSEYIKNLFKRVFPLCKKYGIPSHIPRYIPDVQLKKNIETSTMLFIIAYYLSIKREGRYRAESYRKLAQAIEDMDEDIMDIYKAGKLAAIKGMGKRTLELVQEILETGKCGYLEELDG